MRHQALKVEFVALTVPQGFADQLEASTEETIKHFYETGSQTSGNFSGKGLS